jgi:hypothetical protein
MAREEEGVIKAKKLSGNGARNFPASRASPPEHYRRPQIARASSGAAWLWKNGGEEHFLEDKRERESEICSSRDRAAPGPTLSNTSSCSSRA